MAELEDKHVAFPDKKSVAYVDTDESIEEINADYAEVKDGVLFLYKNVPGKYAQVVGGFAKNVWNFWYIKDEQ